MQTISKILAFTDLVTWQEAHKLVLLIYKFTENFPSHEIYSLTKQLRRAAVSVSSNIAEGFRCHTRDGKNHFYTMAHCSLTEVENQLIIARDLKYLSNENYLAASKQCHYVSKCILGLKASAQDKPNW